MHRDRNRANVGGLGAFRRRHIIAGRAHDEFTVRKFDETVDVPTNRQLLRISI